jgi:predicted DNA-binding protein
MDDLQNMSAVHENRVESTVKLPPEIDAQARRVSASTGATFDDFIAEAIAEKIAALEQEAYFAARVARAQPGRGLELLRRAGTPGTVGPGDEVS